ncbi:LuxR C-terminal-related transcriptional regulator [Streptomyces antarcticus]|uniref:LuxR C-terminal-related transcriptional regulator n=1 Tax=Streptomyces antarcticus TaxID=2996458 RepID=UPI00226E3A87|nr:MULTISPECIES: LuxR C-terminal-related transcriptional regulator [unclassified Streptomyces]MCY0942979.1 LuxR C-terminal-related transcriptional regulator [Streptomyces sp. H34-AA3]MCY0952974.1 LuxR C-terminal-related transcriptional regulator [Streptomyces sp. H27-S2]MCZ4083061.1 LuxR C-terminal-related transcriptional regulator [Streptomyces sp. H34-S5]
MLQVLGLDARTESVYRLMLEQPGLGVDALADALGEDRAAVLTALDRLADLALLRSGTPSPADDAPPAGNTLNLVPPRAGLQVLLARREEDLRRTQLEMEAGRAAVADLLADYAALGRESPAGAVERFTGDEAVRRCLEDLILHAATGLCVFAPTGTGGSTPWDLDVPLYEERLARGVRVRVLHLDSTAGSPERRRAMRTLAQAGAEIRTVPSLPMHMRIADGDSAVLPTAAHESVRGAVVIREPGALAGLRALFSYLWDEGTPLDTEAADAGAGTDYSAQERALLRFLADGLTDEAVARKLGISLRSERRMISSLSERFGTHSRFQLGLQAVQRGLL